MRRPLALSAAIAAALACAPSALAQGGVTAPDFDDPCPALYPGDGAAKAQIARWMAGAAAARGLPWELPVMAGLAESGLTNLRGRSYAGFFGMSQALNTGELRGFPRKPDLQLRWFLDSASLVRQRRVAEGRPDPADDPEAFGIWVADVERPAPENRSGYQKYLDEAVKLAGSRCPAPASTDVVPPALRLRIAATQRPLRTAGVVARVRCPAEDCLAGAFATVSAGGRRYSLRAPAVDPEGGWATLTLRLPRGARRQLARRRSLRARVTGVAADAAANAVSAERIVRLMP